MKTEDRRGELTSPSKTWGGCGKFYRQGGFGGRGGLGGGDQTGAKQIIGRLQLGKTIGQLD